MMTNHGIRVAIAAACMITQAPLALAEARDTIREVLRGMNNNRFVVTEGGTRQLTLMIGEYFYRFSTGTSEGEQLCVFSTKLPNMPGKPTMVPQAVDRACDGSVERVISGSERLDGEAAAHLGSMLYEGFLPAFAEFLIPMKRYKEYNPEPSFNLGALSRHRRERSDNLGDAQGDGGDDTCGRAAGYRHVPSAN